MFKPGDLALVIYSAYPELLGVCVEIVSEEYEYCGRRGHDYIARGIPCPATDSKWGEWFCGTPSLMPLNPPSDMLLTEKDKEVTT